MMRRALLLPVLCLACGASPGGESSVGTSEASSSSGVSSTTTTSTTETGVSPTTSGESSSGESSSGESSGGTSGGLFVPTCRTLLKNGRLALECDLPSGQAECASVGAGACVDDDDDGLTDEWEDLVLGAMRPLRRFDEAETLITDPAAVVGDVGRVVAVGENFRVYVMLGYHEDYGSCGFTKHHGDSERVVIDLARDPEGGVGGVIVVGAYTAAHEGTASDHGRKFVGAELDQLVFAVDPQTQGPRWVVFPSADKHATYATIAICEGISPIPCLDEDCGPDDVADPALFDVLPPFLNAGEEGAPRATELSAVGFPGEQAWADQDFCGGLGGTECSSPVREKLLVDPFL